MKSSCHIDILTWLATALRILLALCKPSRFYSLQQMTSFPLKFSSGNWHNKQNWNVWYRNLKYCYCCWLLLCWLTCENDEMILVKYSCKCWNTLMCRIWEGGIKKRTPIDWKKFGHLTWDCCIYLEQYLQLLQWSGDCIYSEQKYHSQDWNLNSSVWKML